VYSDSIESGSQLFAPSGTSSANDGPTIFSFHTYAKAVGTCAFGVAGLKGHFAHNCFPLLQIFVDKTADLSPFLLVFFALS
jgi:hypothetical protein